MSEGHRGDRGIGSRGLPGAYHRDRGDRVLGVPQGDPPPLQAAVTE